MTALTPGRIIHCDSEHEYREALIAAGDSLVVVDCFAEWCPPCRQIAPRFEALATQHTETVFIKVDVDKAPAVSKLVGVWALPTFAFFRHGKKVSSFMGADERKLQRGLENDGDLGICGSIPCSIQ